jgi:hypothetical protein
MKIREITDRNIAWRELHSVNDIIPNINNFLRIVDFLIKNRPAQKDMILATIESLVDEINKQLSIKYPDKHDPDIESYT